MNVLIYVMTVLMIISVLTYAKLESFRLFSSLEASFKHYMSSTERLPLDRMNKKMYDSIKILSKNVGQRELPNPSSSRLSFHMFVKKEMRENSPEAYAQTRELAKVLMSNLYGNQRFFQEIALKRQNFLDEILNEIQHASEEQDKIRLKNATALSKLKFSDLELQYVFFLMLHGLPNLDEQKLIKPTPEVGFGGVLDIEDKAANSEEEMLAKVESEEAKAPPGYASLIDYITVKPATKIRVFLASRELLVSIYGTPELADAIIENRRDLYRQVRNKVLQPQQASEQFKSQFSSSGTALTFAAILDFAVTNTNPKNYE